MLRLFEVYAGIINLFFDIPVCVQDMCDVLQPLA